MTFSGSRSDTDDRRHEPSASRSSRDTPPLVATHSALSEIGAITWTFSSSAGRIGSRLSLPSTKRATPRRTPIQRPPPARAATATSRPGRVNDSPGGPPSSLRSRSPQTVQASPLSSSASAWRAPLPPGVPTTGRHAPPPSVRQTLPSVARQYTRPTRSTSSSRVSTDASGGGRSVSLRPFSTRPRCPCCVRKRNESSPVATRETIRFAGSPSSAAMSRTRNPWPSKRARPPKVDSHSSPLDRTTTSVTVFWGRPSAVVHCTTR